MSPSQRLQRLLAEIPGYKADEVVAMLPVAATVLSALCVRTIALQHLASRPDTDYLLNIHQVAQRIGKSTKWIRDHIALFPFSFQLGQELRFPARALEQWITEQRDATGD